MGPGCSSASKTSTGSSGSTLPASTTPTSTVTYRGRASHCAVKLSRRTVTSSYRQNPPVKGGEAGRGRTGAADEHAVRAAFSKKAPVLRIGVDVGGTNTDAVATDGTTIRARIKLPTSNDILTGIGKALSGLKRNVGSSDVHSVVVGTTQFLNAIVEARGLTPVVAIRLATLPAPLDPMSDWPDRLRAAVFGAVHVCAGGHQYTGDPMDALDEEGVADVARSARELGHNNFMVSSVFSPVNPDGELLAQRAIKAVHPEASITLSHEIGRIGILERENAAILNAALRPLAGRVIDGLEAALEEARIAAPLYLSQNDGTIVNLDFARDYPIFTVASGPTNSMRGAAVESNTSDCIVIDVGGTTTDVGLLRGGFPRESTIAIDLGGVRTNFRMPDVVSLGIGGGSVIHSLGSQVVVGPDSVGNQLENKALVFGGDTPTFTDVAVAAGFADIGDRERARRLSPHVIRAALDYVRDVLVAAIDRVSVDGAPVPIVTVGGGAVLLGDTLPSRSQLVHPTNAAIANAIGAALATIGVTVDRVFALGARSRAVALDAARAEARARAVRAGAAEDSVRVVDEDDVPLTHLPEGTATRIRVRVVGDLAGFETTRATA